MMYRESGFTLLELILVVLLLGILSVSALPKFLDIGRDARAASVRALHGAVYSSANMVAMKVRTMGLCTNSGVYPLYNVVLSGGVTTDVICPLGWPLAEPSNKFLNILTLDGFATSYFLGPHGWNAQRLSNNNAPNPNTCAVVYEQQNNNNPYVTYDVSGC